MIAQFYTPTHAYSTHKSLQQPARAYSSAHHSAHVHVLCVFHGTCTQAVVGKDGEAQQTEGAGGVSEAAADEEDGGMEAEGKEEAEYWDEEDEYAERVLGTNAKGTKVRGRQQCGRAVCNGDFVLTGEQGFCFDWSHLFDWPLCMAATQPPALHTVFVDDVSCTSCSITLHHTEHINKT